MGDKRNSHLGLDRIVDGHVNRFKGRRSEIVDQDRALLDGHPGYDAIAGRNVVRLSALLMFDRAKAGKQFQAAIGPVEDVNRRRVAIWVQTKRIHAHFKQVLKLFF